MKEIDMKELLKAQQGELDAVLMYNALSKLVKDAHDAETYYAPVVEKYPEVASVQSDEHRHGDMVLALLK